MQISIDKKLINEMPQLSFEGDIVVIDSLVQLNAAIRMLRAAPVVGFDTETRPSFRKGEHHNMSLIQLSTKEICFLFRVNKIGIPAKLEEYLADPECLKIGLSIHDDFHQLARISNIQPAGFVEIQDMVKKFAITDLSLQKIYAILFGKKISKSQRLTNWEATELTASQQSYAALDAWACIHIYEYLSSGEFVPENSTYIVNEEEQNKEE